MSDETHAAFRKFTGMSFLYFGKDVNAVPPNTLALWTNEVGGYPAEFFPWAFEHVKSLDSGRTIISNLPKVVKELWGQWLRANPNRVERHELSQCNNPHCENGWFWVFERQVIQQPDGCEAVTIVKRLAACAECRKLGREMTVGMTRASAQRAGLFLPGGDVESEYLERQEEAFAAAWDRFADVRAPRFVRDAA